MLVGTLPPAVIRIGSWSLSDPLYLTAPTCLLSPLIMMVNRSVLEQFNLVNGGLPLPSPIFRPDAFHLPRHCASAHEACRKG